jgi:hypothetical protein
MVLGDLSKLAVSPLRVIDVILAVKNQDITLEVKRHMVQVDLIDFFFDYLTQDRHFCASTFFPHEIKLYRYIKSSMH